MPDSMTPEQIAEYTERAKVEIVQLNGLMYMPGQIEAEGIDIGPEDRIHFMGKPR